MLRAFQRCIRDPWRRLVQDLVHRPLDLHGDLVRLPLKRVLHATAVQHGLSTPLAGRRIPRPQGGRFGQVVNRGTCGRLSGLSLGFRICSILVGLHQPRHGLADQLDQALWVLIEADGVRHHLAQQVCIQAV